MDRILIILKKKWPQGFICSYTGTFFYNVQTVYLYIQQISVERLQDHCFSGICIPIIHNWNFHLLFSYFCLLNLMHKIRHNEGTTLSYCNSYRHHPCTHPIQCESNSIPYNKMNVLSNANDLFNKTLRNHFH